MTGQKEKRSAYQAEYRAKNRELLREKAAEWYQRNKEERAKYREASKEKIRLKDAAYYAANQEEIGKKAAERYAKKKEQAEPQGQKIKKPPKFKYQAAYYQRIKNKKKFFCETCDVAFTRPCLLRCHFESKKHARRCE